MMKFRRGARRYPLDKSVDDEAEASCEHDGDCLRASCGQCSPRQRVPLPHPCALRGEVRPYASFCGCVEKRCLWFRQVPLLQTINTIDNLAVQHSGKAVTDAVVVARVAELLDEQLDLRPCYLRFSELLPARHRFVVTTLGQYGITDASVTGAIPRLRRCVDDAFAKLLFAPSDISERFPNMNEVRISGVAKVQRVWQ
jgi:hypothetical protein